MRLIYSADDAAKTGKGWYFERGDWKVSQSFRSKAAAEKAAASKRLRWSS